MVIVLVTLLISTIVGASFGVVIPRLCHSVYAWVVHVSLGTVLTVNVAFNYAASVLRSAGAVYECLPVPRKGEPVTQQGSCDNYTYCQNCQGPKPPGAHHCSVCRMCVVDMDHHCPFINNCIGRANLRNFLLFLVWTVLSMVYVLGLCLALIRQHWDVVRRALFRSSAGGRIWEQWLRPLLATTVLLISNAPWWLLVTFYLFAIAVGVLVAVGALLGSQLYYLSKGVTYIDHLQGGGAASKPKLWPKLQTVCGGSNVVVWLLPRWQPVPGTLISTGKKIT